MFKLRYFFQLFLTLLLINFPVKGFSDNHNLKEIIKLIQKDLKTLERAVYSGSIETENKSISNSDLEIDQNSEDVLTRHLLKLSSEYFF